MEELIPLPNLLADEEPGITLSSSGSAVSSDDSSYKAGPSKSASSGPDEDSVHSSDQAGESEPEDGIPLSQLGENPHLDKFMKNSDLVEWGVLQAAVRAFFKEVNGGYVAVTKNENGEYNAPTIEPEPEGLWGSAKEVFQNDELIKDLRVEVNEICRALFYDVNFEPSEKKKNKKDRTSVRQLWNGKSATALRKELNERRQKLAREQKLKSSDDGEEVVV